MMYPEGYNYGKLGDGGYRATHKGLPRHLSKRVTPNFEKKEGLRFGPFHAAKWLPSIRLEEHNWDHFVIAAGAPVCQDSEGFTVPAGYKLILAAGANQGPKYTEADAVAGVKNAAGVPVTPGEFVINSVITEGLTFGQVVGVTQYDVYMNLNGDVYNPSTYQYHNYNRQTGFAVLTSYVLEFPVEPLKRSAKTEKFTATANQTVFTLAKTALAHHVAVLAGKDRVVDFTVAGTTLTLTTGVAVGTEVTVSYLYEENFYASPFAGMTTWRGAAAHGGKVTFNADSKFVLAQEVALDDTDVASLKDTVAAALAAKELVVGTIVGIDTSFPKQLLDQVVTAFDERLYSPIINPETGLFTDGSGLDKMPGSANDGVPHMIQYAGGDLKTGVVSFRLSL
ncbi:MAG: hypothetical protein PHY47_00440 [Lachnospiraceae bacterium]|nr:hypothetical protein [Lachnospiraceae bacterium]